jgi:hypothetical protein
MQATYAVKSTGSWRAGTLHWRTQKWAEGGGDAGLQHPQKRTLSNADFVDTVISTVLRYIRLGQNQPLKSAMTRTLEY